MTAAFTCMTAGICGGGCASNMWGCATSSTHKQSTGTVWCGTSRGKCKRAVFIHHHYCQPYHTCQAFVKNSPAVPNKLPNPHPTSRLKSHPVSCHDTISLQHRIQKGVTSSPTLHNKPITIRSIRSIPRGRITPPHHRPIRPIIWAGKHGHIITVPPFYLAIIPLPLFRRIRHWNVLVFILEFVLELL